MVGVRARPGVRISYYKACPDSAYTQAYASRLLPDAGLRGRGWDRGSFYVYSNENARSLHKERALCCSADPNRSKNGGIGDLISSSGISPARFLSARLHSPKDRTHIHPHASCRLRPHILQASRDSSLQSSRSAGPMTDARRAST